MVRARNAVASRRRKKRLFKKAKGNFGFRGNRFKEAARTVKKGLAYATRDRKVKKREIKRLWSVRINAACRETGLSYSRFIKGLKEAKVIIDRKMLAELAVNAPGPFRRLIKLAKDSLPEKTTQKKKTSAKKQ